MDAELEEGEIFCDDLSHLDEKIERILGPLRKDFKESKFHGYGSFLRTYEVLPSILCQGDETTATNTRQSSSGTKVSSCSSSTQVSEEKVSSFSSSTQVAGKSPVGHQLSRNKSENPGDQRKLNLPIKVCSDKSAPKASTMYMDFGLMPPWLMPPSSSIANNPSGEIGVAQKSILPSKVGSDKAAPKTSATYMDIGLMPPSSSAENIRSGEIGVAQTLTSSAVAKKSPVRDQLSRNKPLSATNQRRLKVRIKPRPGKAAPQTSAIHKDVRLVFSSSSTGNSLPGGEIGVPRTLTSSAVAKKCPVRNRLSQTKLLNRTDQRKPKLPLKVESHKAAPNNYAIYKELGLVSSSPSPSPSPPPSLLPPPPTGNKDNFLNLNLKSFTDHRRSKVNKTVTSKGVAQQLVKKSGINKDAHRVSNMLHTVRSGGICHPRRGGLRSISISAQSAISTL